MALIGYYVYAATTVPGLSPLAALFFLFFCRRSLMSHVCAHRILSVVSVTWLQPQKSKGVCKIENKKSKGGGEKVRIKERKALETDAAKCAKIGSFFNKTSLGSETTNEDDETGEARC